MLRFGTDGVRGVALEELTTDVVRDLGRAIARQLTPTAVVVGRDTRRSGAALEAALVQGITSEGVPVHLLGVAPTPAIAFVGERHDWVAVSITASHNQWQDNGIKVFAAGGTKLSDAQQIEIEREWHAMGTTEVPAIAQAAVNEASDLLEEYVAHRVSIIGDERLNDMSVVVDCANGAMVSVVERVLSATGVQLEVINDSPDGTNINADCGATHLEGLSRAVVSSGADLGIAFDGDGDRVLCVDRQGHAVDGDQLIAIAAVDLAQRGLLRNKSVAVTVMTNLGFHNAMRDHDIAVVVTPVGDRHVLVALEEHDLVLGGEQSGHIIHRAHATTGDGLLAALMLLEFLHRTKTDLRQAASVMTVLPQVLINVRTLLHVDDPAGEMAEELADAETELTGIGRVLLRASGTEPLVRVMVEAADARVADRVAHELALKVEKRYAHPEGQGL